MIERHTELKKDMHVQLWCGCTGFVTDVQEDSFLLLYTAQCGLRMDREVSETSTDVKSMEAVYRANRGPYIMSFEDKPGRMTLTAVFKGPVKEVEIPRWWFHVMRERKDAEKLHEEAMA